MCAVEACARFLDNLCDLLQSNITEARANLFAQCQKSLAHGTLLALRYVVSVNCCAMFQAAKHPSLLILCKSLWFSAPAVVCLQVQDITWRDYIGEPALLQDMQRILTRIVDGLLTVNSIALPPLTNPKVQSIICRCVHHVGYRQLCVTASSFPGTSPIHHGRTHVLVYLNAWY